MLKLKQAVVVEGRYDKIKLSSILDATIIETSGFRIFSNEQSVEMLRVLAKRCGLIIITDSDFAGFRIRNYLKNKITEGEITHVYLPDVLGKEKRKAHPSKEGLLGLEGLSQDEILTALKNAGILDSEESQVPADRITKLDLYELGLSGHKDSKQKRLELLKALNLPSHLSANSLPDVLSSIISKDELYKLVNSLT